MTTQVSLLVIKSECVFVLQWLPSPALPAGVDMDGRQADPPDHVWAQRAATGSADHQHCW